MTTPEKAAKLYEHYLELRKMREMRLKQLGEQQKRVQQHERNMFKIQNRLAQVKAELSQVQEKLDYFVESNIWVTADEHELIHELRQTVTKEYQDWSLMKKKKSEAIDKEAGRAKIHASHIIGIERALVCLEDHIRQEFPGCKRTNPRKVASERVRLESIHLRRSISQYSFNSILTADSKNSTSLSGALLKKWLLPRLELDTSNASLSLAS